MYLHIGGAYTISDKWIIGMFDLDETTTGDSATIDFLKSEQIKGRLESVNHDLPRSFIVTLDKTYLTSITSATLFKRQGKLS